MRATFRCLFVFLVSVLLVIATGAPAAAQTSNLVVNGSFEQGWVAACGTRVEKWCPVLPGSTMLPGWTVTSTFEVDWSISTVWSPGNPVAQDGTHLIDLNGAFWPGSIAQTIATAQGAPYLLTFYYSANPNSCNGGGPKILKASAGTTEGTAITIPNSGWPNGINTWALGQLPFRADASATTISLQSLTVGTCAGPLVDNVSLVRIHPPTAGHCKNYGWQYYGFRNQGDCVSDANANGIPK